MCVFLFKNTSSLCGSWRVTRLGGAGPYSDLGDLLQLCTKIDKCESLLGSFWPPKFEARYTHRLRIRYNAREGRVASRETLGLLPSASRCFSQIPRFLNRQICDTILTQITDKEYFIIQWRTEIVPPPVCLSAHDLARGTPFRGGLISRAGSRQTEGSDARRSLSFQNPKKSAKKFNFSRSGLTGAVCGGAPGPGFGCRKVPPFLSGPGRWQTHWGVGWSLTLSGARHPVVRKLEARVLASVAQVSGTFSLCPIGHGDLRYQNPRPIVSQFELPTQVYSPSNKRWNLGLSVRGRQLPLCCRIAFFLSHT